MIYCCLTLNVSQTRRGIEFWVGPSRRFVSSSLPLGPRRPAASSHLPPAAHFQFAATTGGATAGAWLRQRLSPSLLPGTHRTRPLAILTPPGACRRPWSAEAQRKPHLLYLTLHRIRLLSAQSLTTTDPSSTTSRPRPAVQGCRKTTSPLTGAATPHCAIAHHDFSEGNPYRLSREERRARL